MWHEYNPNPCGKQVGDCAVRAIAKATGQDWKHAFLWLCVYGFTMCDMPSANAVWGTYLRRHGWHKHLIDRDGYTVEDFCREHPNGTYVLALSGHVLTVELGEYWDSWNSGAEIPLYYWAKEK